MKKFEPLADGLCRKAILLLCAGLVCAFTATSQTLVSRKVTDEAGKPIPGATVVVRDVNTGTITNIDGDYSINVIGGPDAVLIYSFLGYNTVEVTVGTRTVINVTLQEDSKQLDEVVVVGYGTMKKADLTGAVGSINAEKLQKEQPATVQDLMRSNIPGLSMGYSTDAKGNALGVMIRGKNNFRSSSITEGSEYQATEPLLVLDGTIYYGQLTDISPSDVERIDVLKDASSAAVYGAQSANGVILITTKKGKAGKPQIRFASTLGIAFTNNLAESYGPHEYVGYRRDVMMSRTPRDGGFYDDPSGLSGAELEAWLGLDGATGDPMRVWLTRLNFADNEIDNIIARKYVNWKDLVYQNAFRQNYNISVSGSQNNTSYYTSLGYERNQGNTRGSGFEAIRARLNLESKINDYITYGINSQFTKRDEGFVGYSSSISSSSPYGDIYDEDGNMNVYPMGNLNSYNPLIDRHYIDRINDYENINASLFLKVDLGWGFSIRTTYSPRYEWRTYMNHKSTHHPLWENATDTGIRRHTKTLQWNWDNILAWNKVFDKNAFDFTFLANWEKQQRWYSHMQNNDYDPNDNLGYHGLGWGTNPSLDASDWQQTGEALMARLSYTYDNKYMFTGTYRRDGFSEFGLNHPYAHFISAGLGWVFTNEDFFPENNIMNYGKLRLSYGENGNRNFSSSQNLALLVFEDRKYNFKDYQSGELINLNTYYAYRMGNHDLKWESTTSYNIGLDFGFLNNRITGSVDVYKKITNDLLKFRNLINATGYTGVWANVGEIENNGVELMITGNNIRRQNFSWTTTFTYAYNKSKINDIDGTLVYTYDDNGNVTGQKKADDTTNGWFIGKPLDLIWGYKFIGVWQENEAEVAAMYGQQPGDPKILDKDGNFTYDNEDKVFIGHTTPRHRLSIRNDFSYKNWTFSVNMYANLDWLQSFNRLKHDSALNNTVNQVKARYWTPENPTDKATRLGSTPPGGIGYSIYREASFLRIENISVGYSFPSKWLDSMKIAAINVNLSLKNAAVFSKWPGEDPETNGMNPRYLYFGLNVTF